MNVVRGFIWGVVTVLLVLAVIWIVAYAPVITGTSSP
jgi:hypothetical protein